MHCISPEYTAPQNVSYSVFVVQIIYIFTGESFEIFEQNSTPSINRQNNPGWFDGYNYQYGRNKLMCRGKGTTLIFPKSKKKKKKKNIYFQNIMTLLWPKKIKFCFFSLVH